MSEETMEETTVEETATEETATLSLTEEENGLLSALRARANQLTSEIGAIEVRKARLIGAISNAEAQANELLKGVAERLEIPAEKSWQVTPEGEIIVGE